MFSACLRLSSMLEMLKVLRGVVTRRHRGEPSRSTCREEDDFSKTFQEFAESLHWRSHWAALQDSIVTIRFYWCKNSVQTQNAENKTDQNRWCEQMEEKTAWRLLEATYDCWHDPEFRQNMTKKMLRREKRSLNWIPFPIMCVLHL